MRYKIDLEKERMSLTKRHKKYEHIHFNPLVKPDQYEIARILKETSVSYGSFCSAMKRSTY